MIEIINNIQFFDPNAVRRALRDIQHKRSISNIKKAEELDKEAEKHFEKYIGYLKKIENKEPISEKEITAALKHLEEYNRLTEKSMELMRCEGAKI